MSDSQRTGIRVDEEVVAAQAYVFNKANEDPKGYVFAVEFTGSGGEKLVANLDVPNPEKPNENMKVVGVMDGKVFWLGNLNDPADFCFEMTPDNVGKFNKCINSPDGGGNLKISWKLAKYNPEAEAFYSFWDTDEKEFELAITPGTVARVIKVNKERKPVTYTVSVSVIPRGAKKQLFNWAPAANLKNSVPYGGIGA